MPDVSLQIGSILLVPVIVAIIEVAKRLGMPVEYAPWANGALSVLAYGAVVLVAQRPDLLQPLTYALTAIVIFLSAAGFYDTAKRTITFGQLKARNGK